MLRYFGFCKAAWRPRFCREIGGGGFVVNAKRHLHALVRPALRFCHCQGQAFRASVRAEIRALTRAPDRHQMPSPDRFAPKSERLKITRRFAPLPKDCVSWPPPALSSPVRSAHSQLRRCYVRPHRRCGAQDSDPVVARANGVDIHQSDLAFAEEEIGGNMPQMAPDQKRDYLITYLADVIVLSQAADQQKLGDRSRRQAPARLRPQPAADGGAAAGGRQSRRSPTTRCTRSTTRPSSRCRPSRKCTPATSWSPTEDEAKAIEAELKKGADFAALAKEKSKDPGAADGGDLGYFTKDQMVPEFADGRVQARQGPDFRSGEHRSSAGTSSRSRTSAPSRRRPSIRSKPSSRIMSRTARRPSWSTTCARPPRSSASTSRRRRRIPRRSIPAAPAKK